jgi:pimeloyl-ACP methyl ester carboxylesterase
MWSSNPVGAERLRETVKRLSRSGMKTILDIAPWFQGLKRKSPDVAKFLRDETLANDPAAYALASESVAADFAGETDYSFLRKIRCPTLIVIGDKDSASIKGALEMCELITNSQLAIIPDCGHFSMYEKPRVLLAMIMEFISDLTE